MPIPAILAGLAAIGAAAIGIGAHADAKETNERAQEIVNDAQSLYNDAKRSLEEAQGKTEHSLLALGNSKKKVLETSINQFLICYQRIKNIELSESVGLDEIKNFTLEEQDTLQLREMSNIYQSTFSSGVTGAATGAIIALAASGSLPVVTGTLSVAGSALAAGEIGMAAGLAGSALSFGAAMTPLAAIAAPAVLFSGISASIKADENLEKAQTMYAEAEAASEKMKTAEVLCAAIADRADMYDNLLLELNGMFSYCTGMLDGVTRNKMGILKNKRVDARQFTQDELKLVAITRSLAGAVKAIIDTPILTAEGAVSTESQDVYEDVTKKLPAFVDTVNEIKTTNYAVKPIIATPNKYKGSGSALGEARNIIAIVIGFFMASFMQSIFGQSLVLGLLAFSTTTLVIINHNIQSKLFKWTKNICCFFIASAFSIFFFNHCEKIVYMNHYIIGTILVSVASMAILNVCLPHKGQKKDRLKYTIGQIFSCIVFLTIAILAYAFLHKFIGISHTVSRLITVAVYGLLAFTCVYSEDLQLDND